MRQSLWRGFVFAGFAGLFAGCATIPPATPATPPAATPPVTTGPATIVMQQSPASSSQQCNCTLCGFLGLNQLGAGACQLLTCLQNELGQYFPGLESTPAMTAIANPANATSSNPAVAAAASVKADEDAAPQKIKALHYLATIGCTKCYPDVEKAFLAGLDDCTEAVRFAAADYLRDAAGCPCRSCREKSCCSPAIRKKLQEIGYKMDEKTKCFKEASSRVRRAARLALERCGCPPCDEQGNEKKSGLPEEGPGAKDLPAGPGALPAPPSPSTPTPASPKPVTP
jgi:hypothetical protein